MHELIAQPISSASRRVDTSKQSEEKHKRTPIPSASRRVDRSKQSEDKSKRAAVSPISSASHVDKTKQSDDKGKRTPILSASRRVEKTRSEGKSKSVTIDPKRTAGTPIKRQISRRHSSEEKHYRKRPSSSACRRVEKTAIKSLEEEFDQNDANPKRPSGASSSSKRELCKKCPSSVAKQPSPVAASTPAGAGVIGEDANGASDATTESAKKAARESAESAPPPAPTHVPVPPKPEIQDFSGGIIVPKRLQLSVLDSIEGEELQTKSMTRTELQKVRNLPGNDRCFDCGALHPQWASTTLSSLVCLNCAGTHRSLGIHKSRIRSLSLDSWSTSQFSRILAGGNDRLRNALRAGGVKWTATGQPLSVAAARVIYDSTAATEYTRALDAECSPDSESDEDEAPGFGTFMMETMDTARKTSSQLLSPCANRVEPNNASMFCCIGRVFSQFCSW